MDKELSSIHYDQYLQLQKILKAQHLRSEEFKKPAHDEMLFIIVHQVYELWFKEILHDLNSVMDLFSEGTVEEAQIGVAISRLDRIVKIQKILVDQIDIIETMTPLDFLDFRNYLLPASGFQSFQFRQLEVSLGLKRESRVSYTQCAYSGVFSDEEQEILNKLEAEDSMLQLVEKWLERTPFLQFERFDFLQEYQNSVMKMLKREEEAIKNADYISEHEKNLRIRMLGETNTYFSSIFNKDKHEEKLKEGRLKLSYRATISALLINLYRDEPLLRQPFMFLQKLIDMDELLTTWRNRHAQMVLRTLGQKIGTGGSSGYDYLKTTADRHRIFYDLHNVSTLLIPRSFLPELPEELKRKLDFNFSKQSNK
ncbi:tryptophan 2,3-dioxygenase family protein [Lutimonas zeaxanthinifaciens]|uniref:tryptophan 2,3-dioxygenase family protein n=1 Tax=Lutimonas zeaxanthinifaciens TaxID=3060215 RepID=UPI00265C96A2|nr:tryptophan 2,3-dioxygenase family protein [Lutimonas sp. YSD2104]WKK65566.1 tryptophan 2,3-dioxygenase family protein [Lutimonas sp. YSD2104]